MNASSLPSALRGPADFFSGLAWVTMLVPDGGPAGCTETEVYFEPGCRNNWHSHLHGQVMVATSGAGYYQERGQPARLLRPGETVSIGPGVVHWHGATATTSFAYLAIQPLGGENPTSWLQPVTDEEYQAVQG